MVSAVSSGSSYRVFTLATTLALVISNVAFSGHVSLFQPGPPDNHGHESHWSWRPLASPPDNMTVTEVKYFIHTHLGVAEETFSQAMIDAIRDAADMWSMPNSGALVNYVEVNSAAQQDLHIHLGTLDGNVGGLLGQVFHSFLGHESVDYDDGHTWHRLLAAGTLLLDREEPWFAGADFEKVILHELGHGLGLGHADPMTEPDSVMILGVDNQGSVLTDADRQAVQHLYGVPEPSSWLLLTWGLLASFVAAGSLWRQDKGFGGLAPTAR